MINSTFTNFKKDFYSRVKDIKTFDCMEFNLLKVVLDGLKVNYTSKGKVRAVLFYPRFVLEMFYIFKRLQNKPFKLNKVHIKREKKIIFFDLIRVQEDKNGSLKSVFFENLSASFSKNEVEVFAELVPKGYLDFNHTFDELKHRFEHCTLNTEEKKLRKELIKTYKHIEFQSYFTKQELENVKFAISNFFHQFKVYNRILKYYPNVNLGFLICHYHKEGQILALKRNQIKCLELQHGLISSQDIFYVFPSQIKQTLLDCLFPDKIYVFGQYFKNILLNGNEFNENQIEVLGYYLFQNHSSQEIHQEIKKVTENKKLIVITTQTYMHNQYITYIKKLSKEIEDSKNSPNYIIVVKPHPYENITTYTNAFNKLNNIWVCNIPIHILFQHAATHISIYSTTLYDAMRYNLQNFSLRWDGFEDYVDEIINNNVAQKLEKHENFLKKNHEHQSTVDYKFFYSDFNKDKFQFLPDGNHEM